MNIFILDKDPIKAAQMQCDKHIVKMTVETAQILCSALHILGVTHNGYKLAYPKHPCVQWAVNLRNWIWLREHGRALAAEYKRRYQRDHSSLLVINSLPIPEINCAWPKQFALAMPTNYIQYKISKEGKYNLYDIDYVSSYREFYKSKASRFELRYTKSKIPSWLTN